MELKDFHVHTNFSDGKNTPEEVVLAAIEKGMTTIGFSDHGYTDFDESYCIKKDRLDAYSDEIAALKEKYRRQITVLCGIEQDYYSTTPTDRYDYVIGSVHYFKCGEKYIPVDESADVLANTARQYFDGDFYAMAETYFRTVGDVVQKTNCTLIGHFDLITKFIERAPQFDTANPRYVAAWKAAADKLLATGVPFEINTGAISRGYRTTPYPSEPIREYLAEHGAKFILSSDSHRADTLCFGFENL